MEVKNLRRSSLSVGIRLFNHADVVPHAIESVLRQSRPPDEVLVVDDASTDGGPDEVERIAATNSRVRLIRSENNQGTPRASNIGFEAARGACVYGFSADDVVLPGFFERAMNALEKHPDAGLFYGDFLTVTQGLEVLERTPSPFATVSSVCRVPATRNGSICCHTSPAARYSCTLVSMRPRPS